MDVSSPIFSKKEFVGYRCCEVCEDDPECLYVLSTGRDCFLASRLDTNVLALDFPALSGTHNGLSEVTKEVLRMFWMNSKEKRGDFCDLCKCEEETLTIDCRGKGLVIAPKTFGRAFRPQTLDLRENPHLFFLGSGSLADIADSLQKLLLPKNMIHLGENSLTDLPILHTVRFEGQEDNSSPLLQGGNIISGNNVDDFLGSVCCNRGTHINLTFPEEGLTFCDATHVNAIDPPGIDSVFLPFEEYRNAEALQTKRASSSIMSEAAESVEMCAEYCHIWGDCRYFTYDARFQNAEHLCHFLSDTGEGLETVCCHHDHYADEAMTIPAYTSGKPPATRHIDDNARVVFDPKAIELSPANNYQTSYKISLGSTPLRGAVQVIPKLLGNQTLNISIWPSKVGFFDNTTTAKISIKATNVEPGAPSITLEIKNEIQACDKAFVSFGERVTALKEETTVSIAVNIPPKNIQEGPFGPLAFASTILGSLTCLLVLLISVLVQKSKSKPAIRFAQIEFLRLLLAGSLLVSIGAILAAVPPTDETCLLSVWLVNVGYALELVPTIVKVGALNRMMRAAQSMRRVHLNKNNLFVGVALILGVVIAFLTLWSVLDPVQKVSEAVTTISDLGFTTITTTYHCSNSSVWHLIAIGWNTTLLFTASVLAFQTRTIKQQDFNEATTLAFMIYSHFVFVIMRMALIFLSGHMQGKTLSQIHSILLSLDIIATMCIYFATKLIPNVIPNLRRSAISKHFTFPRSTTAHTNPTSPSLPVMLEEATGNASSTMDNTTERIPGMTSARD